MCVPDLGQFLVRCMLVEDCRLDCLRSKPRTRALVRELFARNQRWIGKQHWALEPASAWESEQQVHGSFQASQLGMKLVLLQRHFLVNGTRQLTNHLQRIQSLASYEEFFHMMDIGEQTLMDIHAQLRQAVKDSARRGYNEGL
mmetsp:Transcript_27140/g.90209  ORF Transcript_27140/g.90209 Transcript_27140/m.90209 type:complete len:143 (+) Transcript_27140:618-1046(+)